MSNHINRRIASLRERIKDGLDQETLDKLVSECNALAQDTPSVLAFLVLKQVFAEMSAVLEGEAVAVEQHKDLISDRSGEREFAHSRDLSRLTPAACHLHHG